VTVSALGVRASLGNRESAVVSGQGRLLLVGVGAASVGLEEAAGRVTPEVEERELPSDVAEPQGVVGRRHADVAVVAEVDVGVLVEVESEVELRDVVEDGQRQRHEDDAEQEVAWKVREILERLAIRALRRTPDCFCSKSIYSESLYSELKVRLS